MTSAPDIYHHPLAQSNILRLPSKNAKGMYLLVVDSIIQFSEEEDVLYHEVAHRIFSYVVMEGSTFHTIQDMVGLSYALIWEITKVINENGIYLRGNHLKEFITQNNDDYNNKINSRLHQLLYFLNLIEESIDIAWRGVEPVAEFAAIDYANSVSRHRRGGSWWNRNDSIRSTQESEKEGMFDSLLENYPSDFGGYNTDFGSFQNAMKTAWRAYKSVENEQTQRELLRLSMNSLYMEPKDQTVTIDDPINLLLQNVSIARRGDDKAYKELYKKRQLLSYKATYFIVWLEKCALIEMSNEALHYKKYPELLHMLVKSQLLQEGFMTPVVWGQGSIDSQLSSEVSFLNFKYDFTRGNNVLINPAFLINAYQKKIKPSSDEEKKIYQDISQDWWRELIFLESFRQAIKLGIKWHCPFQGFNVLSSAPAISAVFHDEIGELECSDSCFIKKLKQMTCMWEDVFDKTSSCHG